MMCSSPAYLRKKKGRWNRLHEWAQQTLSGDVLSFWICLGGKKIFCCQPTRNTWRETAVPKISQASWHMVKESFAANQRGTSGGKQLFQGYLKLHGVSYNRQTLTSTGDSRKNTNNRWLYAALQPTFRSNPKCFLTHMPTILFISIGLKLV